jgi:hypothetical protein
MGSQDNSNKRLKTENGSHSSDHNEDTILSSNVLTGAKNLARAYLEGTPYRHGVMTNLFRDGFLSKSSRVYYLIRNTRDNYFHFCLTPYSTKCGVQK